MRQITLARLIVILSNQVFLALLFSITYRIILWMSPGFYIHINAWGWAVAGFAYYLLYVSVWTVFCACLITLMKMNGFLITDTIEDFLIELGLPVSLALGLVLTAVIEPSWVDYSIPGALLMFLSVVVGVPFAAFKHALGQRRSAA